VALSGDDLARLLGTIDGAWTVVDGHHLEREFSFPDFAEALAFVNRVGAIAEAEDHHPDLRLRWGAVTVTVWTHTVDGLTEKDFLLAAKVDGGLADPDAGA
jgi:4a-hydroxytetrahydrobiopterin dehydratase